MRKTVTEDDVGKPVFNVDEQRVGVVAEVRDGTAFVDPHPSLVEEYEVMLGWKDGDEDIYPLPREAIRGITDKEVRLETHDTEHEKK